MCSKRIHTAQEEKTKEPETELKTEFYKKSYFSQDLCECVLITFMVRFR